VSGCKARVPDHTDWVDCGDTVLRVGLCSTHLREEVEDTIKRIRTHEAGLLQLRAYLATLTTENG
jgi:hypothetical protein